MSKTSTKGKPARRNRKIILRLTTILLAGIATLVLILLIGQVFSSKDINGITAVVADNGAVDSDDILFVLNQLGSNIDGSSTGYSIAFRGVSGLPLPVRSPILPTGIPEAHHLAWPTAIKLKDKVLLFASIYRKNWGDVGLWIINNGVTEFQGVVFSASDLEPNGIGPTHIAYFPSRPMPFLMYYLVRGERGPGFNINMAESADGMTWASIGTALSIEGQDNVYGIAPSYSCEYKGEYLLFYAEYLDAAFEFAHAAVASSQSPQGPFENRRSLLDPDKEVFDIVSIAKDYQHIDVRNADELHMGMPYIIFGVEGQDSDVVVPLNREGGHVTLDRPLVSEYGIGARIASFASNKVDPSFIWTEDGVWYGIFTTFGHRINLTSEFTYLLRADSFDGPWTFIENSRAPVFSNYSLQSKYSIENPELVRSDAECNATLIDNLEQ